MNCLNINVPQFRQAVAILGKARATEIVNTFDSDYLPTLEEIIKRHEDIDLGTTGYPRSPLSNTQRGEPTNKLTLDQEVTREHTVDLITPLEAKQMFEQYSPQSFTTMLRSWFFKVPTTNTNEKEAFKIVDAS